MRVLAISALTALAACSPFGVAADNDAASPDSTDSGSPSSYPAAVGADTPTAYLRLGENGAATAAKSEVGGLSCAFVGVPKIGTKGALVGDPDPAYELDKNAWLDCGKNFDFVGTQPYSLEIWVRVDMIDVDYANIINKDAKTPAGREVYGVVLTPTSLYSERYVANVGRGAYAANTLSLGAPFHHVVSVYNGSDILLFVDGQLAGTKADARAMAPKDASFVVGGGFAGAIDEVAVYAKVLTPERINAHYAAGRGLR